MTSHPTFRFLIAAGALAFASVLHAQMDPGILGKRHIGAALFLEKVHSADLDMGNGILGTASLPLTTSLDLIGYASHERFSDYSIRDQRLGAALVAYKELEYFKPFVELGLAGTWQESTIRGRTYKSHDGIYLGGIGVEAAVGRRTAVVLKATFNKYFDSDNGDYWTYTAGLNTWFNEKVGGTVSVAFNESETTVYTFGLIYRL